MAVTGTAQKQENFMEATYRIAVLALLAVLVGAVIYEGEKIDRNQYQFSSYDVQRVEVVNRKGDEILVRAEEPLPVTVSKY
jgi:hypothetical protein